MRNGLVNNRKIPDGRELLRRDGLSFASGMIAGLLAHGFAFSNKLLNADEIATLFGKGVTAGSGRWGLELSRLLFPDISMPWIYGLLCLLFLSAASCLLLRVLEIRTTLFRVLLPALIVSFPAQTATFSYMFTSPSYALAFLLAAASLRLTEGKGRYRFLAGGALLVLSVGTYQAYISLVSSVFLLLMIRRLLEKESTAKEVLFYGLRRLAFLAVTLLVYYAVTLLALRLLGGHFETYGVERDRSLPYRAAVAYSAFLHIFTRGFFGFIPTAYSRVLHGLCALVPAFLILRWLLGEQPWSKRGLLLLCLFLLPLSIDCIYLIAEVEVIYSPVLFGFVSVYLLAAAVAESDREATARVLRSLLALVLALITLFNVYFANKAYLKMYLDYENAYAFYTGIAAQIRMTEGYDADSKIAILGEASAGLSHLPELDLGELVGPNRDLVNVYTRESFLRRYVGFEARFADAEEKRLLQESDEVKAMPAYPNYGFIRKIGEYIVVKLG